MSYPIVFNAIGGSFYDFSTKPGQNHLKIIRQCDCSPFIRIIATIVQGFFIFYDDPRPKHIPDRPPTLWLSHNFITKLSVHYCYGHKSSTGTVRRLFHQKSYDSTTPVRRPAGGRKNHTIFCQLFMLWSQIIYGHRTASISLQIVRFYGARSSAGRIVRSFDHF